MSTGPQQRRRAQRRRIRMSASIKTTSSTFTPTVSERAVAPASKRPAAAPTLGTAAPTTATSSRHRTSRMLTVAASAVRLAPRPTAAHCTTRHCAPLRAATGQRMAAPSPRHSLHHRLPPHRLRDPSGAASRQFPLPGSAPCVRRAASARALTAPRTAARQPAPQSRPRSVPG